MAKLTLKNVLLTSVVASMLAGCASTPSDLSGAHDERTSAEPQQEAAQTVFGSAEDTPIGDTEERPPASLYPGTNKTYKPAAPDKSIQVNGEAVSLNFEATPLVDVVHGVLGDILSLEYVVEGSIPGNVTLRTQAPVPRDELLLILESMLTANGVSLLQQQDGRYLVTTNNNFTKRFPRYSSPGSNQIGFSNLIVPLEHIEAAQMVEILRPVAPDGAFVRVDGLRNLLILAGSSVQLNGWLDIVEMFDVDYLKGMSVGIFPIEYTTVDEVKSALSTLVSSATGGDGGDLNSSLIRIATLESLGSVLVVTPKKELLARVGEWIERLDRAPAQSAEPQLFVYTVQNGTAEHLAQLLRSIFGGGGSVSPTRRNEGVAPGLNSSSLSSDGSAGSGSGGTGNTSSRNRSGSGSTSFMLNDTVRVVADEVNNSLLVYATSVEYRKIKNALLQLDVMPSQILIEASIIEVSLDDELQYGLKWFFDNEFSGGQSGFGNVGMSVSNSGNVTASIPTFGYAFSNTFGDIQAVLSALATKDLVKVLSTPSLMVLDNQSASILVGDSQPVLSSTTNGENISTQNIAYRDTGVQLDVTPSVNAGGLVTMDIAQSVTNVSGESETTSPTFFQRNINSKVAVRSGESVVLGGLISDRKTTSRGGLPFLSDLPFIGGLFGSSGVKTERQELLVIITPKVMRTDQDIRDVTTEMRTRMRSLKDYEDSLDNRSTLIGQ